MTDRRMFNRGIFESSVMLNLAAANPDHELESQRIWEALILLADDYGRGKYILAQIRLKAFGSAPVANGKITLGMVENWIRQLIDREKSVALYEIGSDKYFVLTKWEVYQAGIWHRAKSNLPEPPPEIAKLCWKPTEKGISHESNSESDVQSDSQSDSSNSREGKSREKKSKEDYPQDLIDLVDELFPKADYKGWTEAIRLRQVDALDKLIRIDGFPQEEVFSVLRWMRSETEPNGKFPGWSAVFQSIPRLRQNGQEKYISAQKQWQRSGKGKAKRSIDDETKWEGVKSGKVDL